MACNQQIGDFYKWAVFEKEIYCGPPSSKFLISVSDSFSVTQVAAMNKLGSVNI